MTRTPLAVRPGWRDDAQQDVQLWLLATGVPEDVAADSSRRAAYLRGVFRCRLLDIVRREARHAHAALDAEPLAAPDRADRDRLAERVHATLARMRESGEGAAADLLEHRFLDSRSVAVIAEQLNKPPTSVSAQLQRAKRKFIAAWLAGGGGGIVAISATGRAASFLASHFRTQSDLFLPTSLRRRIVMKRKTTKAVALLLLLICLSGGTDARDVHALPAAIDSISFDNNQPVPNPNGAALTLGGTGTYTWAVGNSPTNVSFSAEKGGFIDNNPAAMTNGANNSGTWSGTLPVTSGKGAYECWANLDLQNGARIWTVKTPVPNPKKNVN